ncbi:MAG: isoprenylcysteine carboxylmethyltransferase family protein [Candidatus Bathyarchaeota archaeon]|nr:MAG: isoprenylcysteine carboxylmethyltransferase family protein [Candidatus Bathyarchaeota archaeon]
MERKIDKELRKVAVRSVIVTCFFLILHLLIFFVSAGRLDLYHAWFYFGVVFVNSLLNLAAQATFSPELLKQRLLIKREGSKLWDEVLMRACNITLMFVLPFIAGLDVGRFRWSSLSVYYVPLSFVLYIVGGSLTTRTMIENPHFEPTVRIQEERNHRVITTGPYQFVRHPGYLGGILSAVSIPFMIGSIFAIIPAGAYILLMIIRTWLEDNTLQKELNGYLEYTKHTRHRLFPGVW